MPKNRILVADDNKLNQDLLSAILGNDYDYLYANNGIEVISALEKNEAIDIILLDINMCVYDKISFFGRFSRVRRTISSFELVYLDNFIYNK